MGDGASIRQRNRQKLVICEEAQILMNTMKSTFLKGTSPLHLCGSNITADIQFHASSLFPHPVGVKFSMRILTFVTAVLIRIGHFWAASFFSLLVQDTKK